MVADAQLHSFKLMCVGLAWRGGTVILVNGPRENADSLFQQWDSNGETHVLPADGPPRSSASDIESSESGEDSGDVDDDGANEVPATNKGSFPLCIIDSDDE